MHVRCPSASHWGSFYAHVEDGSLVGVEPYEADPDPSPFLGSVIGTTLGSARVRYPMVRSSVLHGGPGSHPERRGLDPFVRVTWDEALDLAALELDRVRHTYGNEAIFAGSYGWASAGRFHHALGQLHRFMNCLGGYTRSVGTYSFGAGLDITPHVVGSFRKLMYRQPTMADVRDYGELVVMFGGMRPENTWIGSGGVGRHRMRGLLADCARAGVAFVNIGPLRDDAMAALDAEWVAPRPGSDMAIMLALAHTLMVEHLCDQSFLQRYTVGFDRFRDYLSGQADGEPKTAGWAAAIAGIDAEWIRQLARRMAAARTLISCAVSLQRADHGEQPIWMTMVLAAMLGQIGERAGGFVLGLASDCYIGTPVHDISWPALPQGHNPVEAFIPVARISDMLLGPGEAFDYNGALYTYPDIRLIYWAGGNPFHHHQDLNRLIEAFRQPETIIVNEISATATARHADIVLPTTTGLEREDISVVTTDGTLTAMRKAIDPVGESRDDYDIFQALAERLGVVESFTEGRSSEEWLSWLWQGCQEAAASNGHALPALEAFRACGIIELPDAAPKEGFFDAFLRNPDEAPLDTPSGRIEIFSKTVASFDYDDCPGHPAWLEPFEWLGGVEAGTDVFHLVSHQPGTRLHGQLDDGDVSLARKIAGREPVTLHPVDAASRGISSGEVVRLYNSRGACLAGVRLSDAVRRGVAVLATGAWYDPFEPGIVGTLCKHGNPNVLTADVGCSKLSQASAAMSCLVRIERWTGEPYPITAHRPLD